MRVFWLVCCLAVAAEAKPSRGRFGRTNSRTAAGRSVRGLAGDTPLAPAFLVADATGDGMGAECACGAVTSTTGQAVTVTRASAATCTAGNESAITPGQVVFCAANTLRVENPSGTRKEIRVDRSSTNRILRSEELTDAVWVTTGAGTTVSADALASPAGGLTADVVTDSDVAAFGGVTQTFVTATTGSWIASGYLQAGTASAAQVSVSSVGGTGSTSCAFSSLSSSTWRRFICGISSGGAQTALTVAVEVGASAADTGTLGVWGVQLENTNQPSAYIPTVAAAATRATEAITTTMAVAVGDNGSAASFMRPTYNQASCASGQACGGPQVMFGTSRIIVGGAGVNQVQALAGFQVQVASQHVAGVAKGFCTRWGAASGLVIRNVSDSLQQSATYSPGSRTPQTVVTLNNGLGLETTGHISEICISSDTSRCCP